MSFGPLIAVGALVLVALALFVAHGVGLLMGFDLLGYLQDHPALYLGLGTSASIGIWSLIRDSSEDWHILADCYALPDQPKLPQSDLLSYKGVLAVEGRATSAVRSFVDANGLTLVRSPRKAILIPWERIESVRVSPILGQDLEAEIEMKKPEIVVQPKAFKIIVPWEKRFSTQIPVDEAGP